MRRSLLVLALALVACSSRPVPPAGEGIAAVAFRDAVPTWQRVGTRGFTRHYLEQAYDHVTYLEADTLGPFAQTELHAAIEAELRANRAVDVFLLVNDGRSTAALRDLDPALRGKLRLVYNTGAGGLWNHDVQVSGARAYVSHPGSANLAPFFYVDFLRAWTSGASLEAAVARGNASLHDRLSGMSAPLILKASGFDAREEDLPYWEEATRARLDGEPGVLLR